MNARNTTKFVIRCMTNFAVGSVAHGAVKQHAPRYDNSALNFAVDASTFVGGYMAAETLCEPVTKKSDQVVDNVFDWFENTFTKN